MKFQFVTVDAEHIHLRHCSIEIEVRYISSWLSSNTEKNISYFPNAHKAW